MIRKVAVRAGLGVYGSLILSRSAYLEQIKEVDKEMDEWEKEKQKCSLCAMFLESPCRQEFIHWSKCVDKAKLEERDFVNDCSETFEPLIRCQSKNIDYFSALSGSGDSSEEDDLESENDSNPKESIKTTSESESEQKEDSKPTSDS
jgi:hypothetical protein